MPDDRAGTAAAAEIFEPRGAVELERRQTSPRKASLSGLRLAILDNSEWNANKLLHGAAAALADQIAFASANCDVKTRSFSTDAPPEQAARFAAENDVAPTAIGDCGSCCYFCSRDAVALADLGLPSAPIIATEFVDETRLTRQAVGMPDLRSVAIDHPVSSITDEEVAARVAVIAAQAQAQEVWLGARADI